MGTELNKFRWLHLSDIHVSKGKSWDSDPVIAELLKECGKIANSGNFRPNAIFFTGDAVFGNLPSDSIVDQYKAFGKFLDQLRESFSPPIEKSAIYLVPGNHDVDRSNVLEAEKEWLKNERHGIEEIENALDKNSPDCKQWMSRLMPYRNFLIEYELTHLNPDHHALIWSDSWQGNSFGVKILGMNTAWSCCEGKEKGSLRMGGRWQAGKLDLHKKTEDFTFVLLHHPASWLHETEDPDFREYLNKYSDIQLHGHEHQQFISERAEGKLVVSAGACYDRRGRNKAFSFGEIDREGEGALSLRCWDDSGSGWVKKSIVNCAEDGVFSIRIRSPKATGSKGKDSQERSSADRQSIIKTLQSQFENAATCYSSYSGAWVERAFAKISETSAKNEDATLIGVSDLIEGTADLLIHAPVNFGLTCVGRRICLQKFKHSSTDFFLYLRIDFKPHKEAVLEAINEQLGYTNSVISEVTGIILDGVSYDKTTRRILKELRVFNPDWRIIALHSRDDMSDLSVIGQKEVFQDFQSFHLWSLNRLDVRQLVEKCISKDHILSEEDLTDKIIKDLDALNIHRTPLNCLTLLKTNENQVDETPVNRTEMIKRVLSLFFNQFNSIPRYSERPDLVDCEYILGMFSEMLIRRQEYRFSKLEFLSSSSKFAEDQKLPLEVDVLFMFLASERIIVARNGKFEFRFAYWLHYFAAHRMHHSEGFRKYILDDGRYIFFPEIIEFYAGIDRRREDAVTIAIRDLKKLNAGFSKRSGISPGFNPYDSCEWKPSGEFLESLAEEVEDEAKQSTLPQEAKDAIADRTYDRSKAYSQEVQKFIKESTLPELISAARGCAKTLRNSDYVAPALRKELLEQVMYSWEKVAQALLIISPILARDGRANFEGMGFRLVDFDKIPDDRKVHAVVDAIPYNVVEWFEQDLHSKKLGLICLELFAEKSKSIAQILLRQTVILHKPKGWEGGVECFMRDEPKESFYLYDVFRALRSETKVGKSSVVNKCKKLAATAIAKHWTGRGKPAQKTIKEALARLEQMEGKNR